MNTKRTGGRRITAQELEQQLADDEQFQARRRESEAHFAALEETYRVAEKPLIEALGNVGLVVDSVWDLVNTSDPYPAALPVLIRHLASGDYPDRVLEGIARALAVKPAVTYWDELERIYRHASGPDVKDGVAVALQTAATKAQIGRLMALLSDTTQGPSRIFFVSAVLRLGGLSGWNLVQSLTSDPEVGKEAAALIGRRKKPAR